MSKALMVVLGLLGITILTVMILVFYGISVSNHEVRLRTTIEAKQKDNTSEFDNMWKKISQVAQVTDGQKKALLEIFTQYAEARTTDGGGLMKWVQESVPNVDTSTFNNLQNIITSSRDAWTFRQKELIDLNREHTQLIRVFPGSMVLSLLGRKELTVQIVTSSKTEKSFETGKDDDTLVFPTPSAEKAQ